MTNLFKMNKSLVFILLLSVIFPVFVLPKSNAAEYVEVSVIVKNDTGLQFSNSSYSFCAKGDCSGRAIAVGQIREDRFSAFILKSEPMGVYITFNIDRDRFTVTFRLLRNFESDSRLTFVLPAPLEQKGRLVDASGNPISDMWVTTYDDSPYRKFDSYLLSDDGAEWQGLNQSHWVKTNSMGEFTLFVYPTINSGYSQLVSVQKQNTSGTLSTEFKSLQLLGKTIPWLICLPRNFGVDKTLYVGCLDDIESQSAKAKREAEARAAAEKAAAELKAKQEAEAKAAAEKAAAELKAKQEAEANATAKKKTTITCVKGKTKKKVTARKPKCPKGYKKK